MTTYFSLPFFDKSVYTEDDLIAYYLPMRAFYQDCLIAGEIFDWLPNIGMGIYIHGEGENGFYHPLHLLLYRFLPLHLAFNIDFIWPFLFLLPGTYLFARRLSILPFAALFGSAIFTYCGFFMSHYIHMNMLAVACHIPWLLLFINVLLTTKNPRTVLYSVIAITPLTASQFLHGFPQAMYWSMMAEIAYALYLWPSAQHLTRYVHITWAKILAVFLGAIQWLPTKDVLDLSWRAETTREAAMAESIHPANIFQFISPYLFHQRMFGPVSWDAVYIGSMTLILALWLLTRIRNLETYRRLTIALFITAIATFCFSLGDYGHMYGWKMYIPVINGFHSPGRLIILTHFALVLCAALAIVDLYKQNMDKHQTPWQRLWPLAILPIASWSLVVVLWAVQFFPDSDLHAFVLNQMLTNTHRILGAMLISTAALIVALAARGRSWALPLIIIFALADISLYSLRHKDRMDLQAIKDTIEMPPETEAYRVSSYY